MRLDGAKILGETRRATDGSEKKLRYFYDAQGICGFSYQEGTNDPEYYTYVRDIFGNVIMIEDNVGKPVVRYIYQMTGSFTSKIFVSGKWYTNDVNTGIYTGMNQLPEWGKYSKLASVNPFRWKGHYYDAESGYYYANGRYYDPLAAIYIDSDDPENILESASVIGGLDKNAITLDNYLTVESNAYDIFTTDEMSADITYDPMANVSWWERNWGKVVNLVVQIFALIASIFACNVFGVVFSLIGVIGSIADMILMETCPAYAKIAGGLGTISNGYSSFSTGIGMMRFGPVGWVIGAICIIVGISTMLMGVNEAINGSTGVNYLREWTGMSQEDYNTLYLALNITSSVCVIVGGVVGNRLAKRRQKQVRKSQCFMAGTLIVTAEGLKKIEDIRVGDMVLAYDEETCEQVYKKVVRLFRNETNEWYHIRVNGEVIVCTGGHPFYVLNASENRHVVHFEGAKTDAAGKWITAKELRIFDKLLLSDGSSAIIEEIQIEQLEKPETTYNFEVEDYHTYYVTENKVLVHNMCPGNEVDNPLEDIKYTDKVIKQMSNTDDLFHSFPKAVDNFGGYGVKSTIVGGDNIERTLLRIPGSINGTPGYFEYIYDINKVCNHRCFSVIK